MIRVIKRLFVLILLFSHSIFALAQSDTVKYLGVTKMVLEIASQLDSNLGIIAEVDSLDGKWTTGTLLQLGFSQMSLSNWNAGGSDNLALNAYMNMYRNYTLANMFWESRMQMGYGFMTSFGTKYRRDRFKKTDDRFIIDSKLGYRAIKNVFASAVFNFRSQVANGYTYPSDKDTSIVVSAPFSPAYISLGVGADYKPTTPLSINVSPLTGNLVIVGKKGLRTRYGNKVDQFARLELGAQVKVDYKKALTETLSIQTTLNLFSDYLGVPSNIKVHWDLFLDAKLSKYFSTSIKTNLIYDDDILIAGKDGKLAPRLQFKEMFSVGFSYTFGEFKK